MSRVLYLLLLSFFLISCKETKEERVLRLVEKWSDHKLLYAPDMKFTIQGKDTVCLDSIPHEFRITTYVDSVGCVSCKLNLDKWMKLADEVDLIFPNKVLFQFIFQPYNLNELMLVLKRDKFRCPICIDMDNKFSKLNQFPRDPDFNTFLLDKDNKVLAIGNPIHNPKVKELYLKIIQGEEMEQEDESKVIRTKVDIDKTSVSLGHFDWKKEQKTTFVLTNAGNKPLVVEYINTSCGCTSVDYSKEPVQPGKEMILNVTYKAEHPEHFSKTITVHCNAKASPLLLKITGNAE